VVTVADPVLSNVTVGSILSNVTAGTDLSNVTAGSILSQGAAESPFRTIDANLILFIIGLIIVAYVITYLLSFILTRVSERIGWYRSSVTMIIPLLKIVIYAIALYYITFAIIAPSLTQLVAFSGLFGAAIGFGLKDLFADLVGGIVIVFEKPYQIGDKVTIGNQYGEVKDIGLRSTRIQSPADEQVSLPNFTIFSQPVSSGNSGDLAMMIVIDLFVHPESDAGRAMKILKDALVTSKYVIISKKYPYTVLVEDFPFYKRIRAKGYVSDHRQEFEFKSEVTRRALVEFQRSGIRPPSFVPHSGTTDAVSSELNQ
jgi:small-conductance mechanosensitive channel